MNAGEQAIENKLNATLVRLRAGVLPGEQMSAARAPTEQVAHSAFAPVSSMSFAGRALRNSNLTTCSTPWMAPLPSSCCNAT